MQRAIDLIPLRFRAKTGKILRLFILLLMAAAPAMRAQELALALAPVTALAPVSYDRTTVPSSVLTKQNPTVDPLAYTPAPQLQYQWTIGRAEFLGLATFSVNYPMVKRSGFDLHDWSQRIIKRAGEAETSFWGHLQAGYGQFSQLESFSGRDTIAQEQPSFAFLKARFSF